MFSLLHIDSHSVHPLPWCLFTGDKVICDWEWACVPALCQTTVHWLVHACSSHSLLKTVILSVEQDLRRIPSIISGFNSFFPSSGVHKLSAISSFVKNKLSSFRANLRALLLLASWARTCIWDVPLMNILFSPTASFGSPRKQPSIGWVGKSLYALRLTPTMSCID